MNMATVLSANEAAYARDGEIEALGPWFHNLHLPDGRQTAPNHSLGDFPTFKWNEIAPHIPRDLTGWRVLDIGCNAGFYTFKLAERGAHVTAIDSDPRYLGQAHWAAEQFDFGDRIEFREMQIYDLARTDEQYDLIWFMGVLYHLRHPLLALDILRRRAKRLMVLQTLSMPGNDVADPPQDIALSDRNLMLDAGWPKMAFIEHKLREDITNWWAPNRACVEAMLRASGFAVKGKIADETYLCEAAHALPEIETQMIDAELRAATGT
jgi:tRNA (mo5U34)-methyltransferase